MLERPQRQVEGLQRQVGGPQKEWKGLEATEKKKIMEHLRGSCLKGTVFHRIWWYFRISSPKGWAGCSVSRLIGNGPGVLVAFEAGQCH